MRGDAGGLTGVLSEADLLDAEAPLHFGVGREAEASRRRRAARTVGQACSRPAREVAATAPVRLAAGMMRDHDIARLIVVDESEVVGVVSRHDVLKALVRADTEVQAELDRLLAEYGEEEVKGTVDWGIAHVTGRVSRRSTAGRLRERVEDFDGVVGVDFEVAWDVDDIIPPVML